MRWLRPASEDEMVVLFLRTELASVRHQARLRALLDRAALPERLLTAADLTSPTENAQRRCLLSAHRGYEPRVDLFAGFPRDVQWDWVAIPASELLRVRYINYDYWAELSGGSRRVSDAPARVRAGVAPFGVSSEWAIGFGATFAAGATFPPLILVTTGRDDDLVVLEGHARLTAYAMRPEALPPELEVLLGVSPGMRAWGLW